MSVRVSAFTGPHAINKIFLVVVVLLTIPTCDCKRDCRSYDYYQELERALISDAENLFKLRQMFFPTLVEGDPHDKFAIKVCILISNDQMLNDNSTALTEMCWIFDYSSTLLTGLITPAQLHAFESITAFLLVNKAVHFRNLIDKNINLPIQNFPCTVTDQELHKSLAILTSWVSKYMYIN